MSESNLAVVTEIVERYGSDPGRLMDIARAVQSELGHISEETTGQIAEALGLHRVEVRDTVSFYAFFSEKQLGKNVIRLCNSVVERMMGADEVAKAFEEAVGVPFGSTTPDGSITLEYTACIGMSDHAPSALVNGVVLSNIKPADVEKIVNSIKKGDAGAKLHSGGGDASDVDSNLRQPGPVIFSPMEKGSAIRAAVDRTPEEVINELNKSRLRGRGGAGFPTAMKWDFCRKAKGDARYVVCNADEGEPGTFKDRVILTEAPDLLFEGMTVAGYAMGAKEGLMYLRGEYEYLLSDLEQVLAKRRRQGLLGENICGREDFDFDIRIQLGAGAYVCGEESALLESLEGKRGAPRDRPPFPAQKGYKGLPTSINNVESLCCAARILEKGADWFREHGTRDSTGTKLVSISGDCERPGVYEIEYGTTIEQLLILSCGEDAQAVQVGGPSGKCVAPKDFGRTVSFEDLPTGGSIVVFGPERDLLECMRQYLEFFEEESCGWCAPCRAGTSVALKLFDKIVDGQGTASDFEKLESLCEAIKTMSRCGLGQTATNPITSTIGNFSRLYASRLVEDAPVVPFDLDKAMAVGREVRGM